MTGRVVGIVALALLFIPLIAFHVRGALRAHTAQHRVILWARAANLAVVGGSGVIAILIGDKVKDYLVSITVLLVLSLLVIGWAAMPDRGRSPHGET